MIISLERLTGGIKLVGGLTEKIRKNIEKNSNIEKFQLGVPKLGS